MSLQLDLEKNNCMYILDKTDCHSHESNPLTYLLHVSMQSSVNSYRYLYWKKEKGNSFPIHIIPQ